MVEVADYDGCAFAAAGADNNIGRTVNTFALVKQYTEAAVAVRGHDVQFAVAVEVGQSDVVGLLRRPGGIVDRLFEFSGAKASQHGHLVVRTPASTVGHIRYHIDLAIAGDLTQGDAVDAPTVGLATTDRGGDGRSEHAV